MAENSPKAPEKKNAPLREPGRSLFTRAEDALSLKTIFERELHSRYLPQVLFVVGLGILYIANTHWADRTTRRIEVLRREVSDLRADYTTLKAEQMVESKQSKVLEHVQSLGLVDGSDPPRKLIVNHE